MELKQTQTDIRGASIGVTWKASLQQNDSVRIFAAFATSRETLLLKHVRKNEKSELKATESHFGAWSACYKAGNESTVKSLPGEK
jgi:hypothetical protein